LTTVENEVGEVVAEVVVGEFGVQFEVFRISSGRKRGLCPCDPRI